MTKTMATITLALSATLMAGCQGGVPTATARPAAAAAALAASSAVAPAAVAPAAVAKRRLLGLAPTSRAKLFGIRMRTDEPIIQTMVETWLTVNYGYMGRRIEIPGSRTWTTQTGWRADMDFAGDGELAHLGKGRFLYVVPDGRMLVLNHVEHPYAVKINGFRLGSGSDPVKTAQVDYVFAPGETVLFELEPQDRGYNSPRPEPAIAGYTADPALFGGDAGAGGGEPK